MAVSEPSQTLVRLGALRVKCEMDTQRGHPNAVQDVLVERERTPSAQLQQALAALKENEYTAMRVSPFPHAIGANTTTKLFGVLPHNLFRRRDGKLFRRCSNF